MPSGVEHQVGHREFTSYWDVKFPSMPSSVEHYNVKASVRPDAVSDMTILQRLTQKFPIYFVPVEKVNDREEPRKYTPFTPGPYKP